MLDVPTLTGRQLVPAAPWAVRRAEPRHVAAYRALRREVFVAEQGLFSGHDLDRTDEDERTQVLVAVDAEDRVLGGVRIAPDPDALDAAGRDIGWWAGSRLVVAREARGAAGIGAALVRSACARVAELGVLRFEATVQVRNRPLFERLGWQVWGTRDVQGRPHDLMRWPLTRVADLVGSTKAALAGLIGPLREHTGPATLGGAGFVGDDGAPVPGSDVVAACDAILPAMLERDPEWAGWCAVLVNVNDLTAMGADPTGLMDALGAPTASFARRVLGGLHSASQAWGVPVLGGHTQLGVPASLAVTALGRTEHPVPGGGGRPGHALSLTADLSGRWRRGFEGRQWDSTSSRSAAELRHLAGTVGAARPHAAKDVSMAGVLGTTAMLAEASGTGATIDVGAVPMPDGAAPGDWLTCFPGFAILTADPPGAGRMSSPLASTAECGELTSEPGVRLRWPDGETTVAVPGAATGLGRA
ncbi:MSMEG_0567/sll0787 family protein [Myceligenerans pegani]|uniref:GNAT family N-acetyltransferase n=1 Tax=Myceligenerans pegani TaxID=2776917 RepID=A0ABR9MVK0_9MICO|nr:MSMEG_0567/sll0787 family protein [Myceligenerans sp. TRM 65318]MBE1875417.1 GNAT family N-acetyltransferase [Myceligenerans sp. TRM 65318]MBE3017688.1 GNAT family N-acetyltransferase [Myceligenerans sp. TRM 65318]